MTDLLPITVVAAIVLFVLKEVIESLRRAAANTRKLRAVQTLLAAEIERNHFVISRLEDILTNIDEAIRNKATSLTLTTESDGHFRLGIKSPAGSHSWPVPTVHQSFLSSTLLELALLDKGLFDKALAAADAIRELTHVRRSMIQQVTERISTAGKDHLGGFIEYALRETAEAKSALAGLYLLCTGKPLTSWRVR